MKISQVRTTVVTVPFTRPEVWARGARPCVTSTILELETDDGLVGLGECGGAHAAALIQQSARYFLGADPFDLIERLRIRFHSAATVFYALETALLDIQGQATGQPLFKLFGGMVHAQVPFMYYLLRDTPEVMAHEAAEAVRTGWETIYIKVGVAVDEDLAVIRAVRKAIGPRLKFRIDPNQTWTIGTAARIFRMVEPDDIELVEDPAPCQDFAGWRKLRASTSIPLAAQENARTLTEILTVIREDAADIILIDPRNGGLSGMKRAAVIAEAAGLPVYMHSGGDLGIATAALTHLLATIPNNVLASQTYYQFMGGDVTVEQVDCFQNGCLTPSERPGLGVSLDADKLARFHEVYVRGEIVDGSYRRDDPRQEVSAEYGYYPKF